MLLVVSVWTSRVPSKTLEYNGGPQPLEDSVAGHHCVTLSHERHAGLLKLENSPDLPTSRLRPTSHITCPEELQIKACIDVGNLSLSLCSNNICGQLEPDRNPTANVFDSDKRVVLQTARDANWQDPLTRFELSVTPSE